MSTTYYVYILTNRHNTVLYVGVTNNLERRLFEHKNRLVKGFTSRYNIDKLVYYETCEDAGKAIVREKELKGWLRKRKEELIEKENPGWEEITM